MAKTTETAVRDLLVGDTFTMDDGESYTVTSAPASTGPHGRWSFTAKGSRGEEIHQAQPHFTVKVGQQ